MVGMSSEGDCTFSLQIAHSEIYYHVDTAEYTLDFIVTNAAVESDVVLHTGGLADSALTPS